MLYRNMGFASLASWSLLRQKLFLFGFSFWGCVFSLISERLQLAVWSCLEVSSIAACPLLLPRGGAAQLQLAIGFQQSRGDYGVTPAQTHHCLACFWLSSAQRKLKKSFHVFWPCYGCLLLFSLLVNCYFSRYICSYSFLFGGKGLVEPIKGGTSFQGVLLQIILNQDRGHYETVPLGLRMFHTFS